MTKKSSPSNSGWQDSPKPKSPPPIPREQPANTPSQEKAEPTSLPKTPPPQLYGLSLNFREK